MNPRNNLNFCQRNLTYILKALQIFNCETYLKALGNNKISIFNCHVPPMREHIHGSLAQGLSAVDLLVLTSSDKLLFILQTLFTFYKTIYLNEEVKLGVP